MAFASQRLSILDRCTAAVVVPSKWRAVKHGGGEDREIEIRIVAKHCDGGWLYEWVRRRSEKVSRPGRLTGNELGHTTDENLRALFRPVGWRRSAPPATYEARTPDGEFLEANDAPQERIEEADRKYNERDAIPPTDAEENSDAATG